MKVMTNQIQQPDPAAVFACALSLWRECMRRSRSGGKVNLSECYNGGDEFMRVIMRAGTRFEEWASAQIAFEALDEVWPYLLEEKFGKACVTLKGAMALDEFDDDDCLEVALNLKLPIKAGGSLPTPIDVIAENPIANSEFRTFRIQTVREWNDGGIEPFTSVDDPFDQSYGRPFFGLYGVCAVGTLEHIADFGTYADAVSLVQKLAPGIQFPAMPT